MTAAGPLSFPGAKKGEIMKIRDLWKRLVSKFRKNRKEEAPEPVIVIEREEAPEPEPERKTSDEMIVAMAEAAAGNEPEVTDENGQE